MNTRIKSYSLFLFAILIAIGLVLVPGTSPAATITVDAKSNIFGAGHAVPPAPGGAGPGILPPVHYLAAGPSQVLTFSSVTGSKSYNGGGSWWGPEGYDPWLYGMSFPAYGGISGIVTNSYQFLAGIFLDDAEPVDPAPSSLDFGPDGLTRNFTEVYPEIGQLFFIGDGMTDSAETQRFHVPPTATRLFLGFIDTDASYLPGLYHDNIGSLAASFDISPEPPPPALVGYWKFDENSGGMAYDSSGYGNDGQITGATWVEGKCGSGLNFDGAEDGLDYVLISDQGTMSIDTSTFTISFWVKLFDLDRHHSLLDKRHGYHLHNYWFAFYDSSTPPGGATGDYLIAGINDRTINTSAYDEGPYARVDDPPLMQPNVFYFVTATYDHNSGNFILYLDGNVVGTNNVKLFNPIIGDGDLYFGAHPTHDVDYATDGIIDEVRIYNYVLTQEEIRADMAACVPPPDLSGCIKLNGQPMFTTEVTLHQQGGPKLTTMTNSAGCYEFEADVGKKIKIEFEAP